MKRREKIIIAIGVPLAVLLMGLFALDVVLSTLHHIPNGHPQGMAGKWKSSNVTMEGTVVLDIRADGSFTEHMLDSPLGNKDLSGKWVVKDGKIVFETFLMVVTTGSSKPNEEYMYDTWNQYVLDLETDLFWRISRMYEDEEDEGFEFRRVK